MIQENKFKLSDLKIEDLIAEPIWQARASLGEGAIWDEQRNVLYWIDINNHLLHCYDPKTNSDSSIDVKEKPGCVVRRADDHGGGFMLGLPGKFIHLENQTFKPGTAASITVIATMEQDIKTNRMNDGKCDPAGRFWCGSMVLDFNNSKHQGNLWMLDRNHDLHLMLSGVTISNGIVWNGTKDTMYYIDTETNKIDAFDYDNQKGTIKNRRTAVANSWGGHFDGMTIDSNDNLYVAVWGGSAVQKINPLSGELLATIKVPGVKNVTSCAFGGPKLEDLYITSSAEGADIREEPNAGALFRIRLGNCHGLPAYQYLG